MVLFILGTTGELIKVAPVMKAFTEKRLPYRFLCTGQQATQLGGLISKFGLPSPDLWLARGVHGRDLEKNKDVLPWITRVLLNYTWRYAWLQSLRVSLVLVHGDTFTTVLGALMGRILGVPVGHIEAGLRSYNVFNPFPEELDRLLTSKLARYHFAPGKWACQNLRGKRGRVIDTRSNTLMDSLSSAPEMDYFPFDFEIPDRFGLVSLHRFELINDRDHLEAVLDVLAHLARRTMPLVFIDHPVTVAKVDQYGLQTAFARGAITRIPRLDFFTFIGLLRKSAFIVTDSGGNQEECYYLGKPCIIHRAVTERKEGLGENCRLTGFQVEHLRRWVENHDQLQRGPRAQELSPSAIIVETIRRNNLI